MGKNVTKRSTGEGPAAVEKPGKYRQLKLPEILINTQEHLMQLCLRSGIETLRTMLEEDRTSVCGLKHAQEEGRTAYRAGTCPGQVVLGGRKVQVQRPRVRSLGNEEIPLPTWRQFTCEDPLNEHVMAQILAGITTRAYPVTLEAMPEGRKSRGTSRASVSRRFVAGSRREVERLLSRSLEGLDFPVILLDGIGFGESLLVVALGISRTGDKQILGVVEGSTESEAVCGRLLRNLIERGLVVERERLFVIDGGKGLHKAVQSVFGVWALFQRCQVHKMRNVLESLPERMRDWVKAAMKKAYASEKAASARRKLLDLASHLEEEHPGAAGSIREGLEETLTVLDLGVGEALARTLRSTNAIENVQGSLRRVSRNVKRWRGGTMALRWGATALVAAEKKFRRIKGYRNMPLLIAALEAKANPQSLDAKSHLG